MLTALESTRAVFLPGSTSTFQKGLGEEGEVCVWGVGGGLSRVPSSAHILSMLIAPILH